MTIDRPTVLISADALRHNLKVVRERVAPAVVMTVIKDNAYGHSQELVLEILLGEGVTRLGTLDLPGSMAVRHSVPDAMIFAWVIDCDDDVSAAIHAGIDLGVTDPAMLERVAREARAISATARVHLKLDSGLHRAGTLPEQWAALVARAAELQSDGLISVRGLWTHLSEASEQEDSRSIAQFTTALETARRAGIVSPVRHLAASAAAFSRADARFDMVRVGAFLYGIGPGAGIGPAALGLIPVMTLQAPVVAIVHRDSRVFAEIAIGAAAGILSDAAGAVFVAINARRFRVIAVEPARTIIDVTENDSKPFLLHAGESTATDVTVGDTATVGDTVMVGDTVTLFGSGALGEQTLQEWADAMNTIGEELACRVSAAIPRVLSA